jgi:hypothetical protein
MMLISSIFTMNLFVLLVPASQRTIISDWLVNVCAAAVVVVSVMILCRQKFKGLYGRTYGAVAIGLLLWFSAEMISTYESYWATNSLNATRGPIASLNSIELQPSVADAIWPVGYGFFAYFLFRMMIHFSRSIKPRTLVLIGSATGIVALILAQSITYYFNAYASHGSIQTLVGGSDVMATLSLFLHIEYPVLDLMLIVPALVILSGVKDGKLTSTPWLLISAAVLILAVGDIGSIYSSVLHIAEGLWVWKMFATAGYLCIATSLFWYNRFFIFDSKRVNKIWQESNR